jgi:hypothetical protein
MQMTEAGLTDAPFRVHMAAGGQPGDGRRTLLRVCLVPSAQDGSLIAGRSILLVSDYQKNLWPLKALTRATLASHPLVARDSRRKLHAWRNQ